MTKPEFTWYGTPVKILKFVDDGWANILFLESNIHFHKGDRVTISRFNLKPKKCPVVIVRTAWVERI